MATTPPSPDIFGFGKEMRKTMKNPLWALALPITLPLNFVRPLLYKTLTMGKDVAVEGIRKTSRAAMNAVLSIPALPIPGGSR